MIANCKNGVSSCEIHRALGVTQKTAWFMLQRIRLAMQDERRGGKLGGEVEVDETFIGGKARNMHAGKRKRDRKGISRPLDAGKVAVMGLLERHAEKGESRVAPKSSTSRKQHQLAAASQRATSRRAQTVYTDALKSYDRTGTRATSTRSSTTRSYVDGNVHTNGLENFWGS